MKSIRNYKPQKESRGWYFVEYLPPRKNKFATLCLIITEKIEIDDIISAMEKELEIWLGRYPIPLFVTSFDDKGNVYELSARKPCNHLMGYLNPEGNISLFWRLLREQEIPNTALDQDFVDNLYSNFDFKTDAELTTERVKRRKQIQLGWLIFFIWLVIIPATIAILEYSSNLLSLIALIYSLYKAIQKGLELVGKWPKSKKQKEKEIEDRLKDHYFYHCQLNPDGFQRLKMENLEVMSKDEISKEAKNLQNKNN